MSPHRGIAGSTRVAAVIGDPVRHSLSPTIHNAAFESLGLDWAFVAFEVAEQEISGALQGVRSLGIDGLSVTMPHKSVVARMVDRCSPAAEELGAVNCVVRRGGRLMGENTDGEGFLDALVADAGFDPAGRRCVVLGAGGAARAVIRALGRAGAAEVVVVNRTQDRGERAALLAGAAGRTGPAEAAADADLVVNATPVGMGPPPVPISGGPPGPVLPVDPALLCEGQLVADLVYEPLVTPLMDAARAGGAVAVGGVGMLIHQAAHAFRLWTGEDPPLEVMSAAALAELARRG
ncbi:MAG: shikimate dehydrogenase [Acidimicrobiales bacterium]|nr:shikimate dehydrogenase [Acidimicrobiales bacterium]